MGRRGPRPQPAALKMLDGTYREHRHGQQVQLPPGDIGDPPEWLSHDAVARWHELRPRLPAGLFASIDRESFTAYCFAWGELLKWQRLLQQEYKASYAAHLNAAQKMVAHYIARFGFSPGDRANLKITPPLPQDGMGKFFS